MSLHRNFQLYSVTAEDTIHDLNPEDLTSLINEVTQNFFYTSEKPLIIVSARKQVLFFIQKNKLIHSYKISTAEAGLGCQTNSYQTPLGIHQISEKIGSNAQIGTVFKGRKDTGKIATFLLNSAERSPVDNITTRILWLSGLEEGINKGGNVDSHSRYIYIHGTDEEGRLGKPASHGCVRMSNRDVIELFGLVHIGTLVYIID